jgi:hypothetical protein
MDWTQTAATGGSCHPALQPEPHRTMRTEWTSTKAPVPK